MHLLGFGGRAGDLHAWGLAQGHVTRIPLEGAFAWDIKPMRTCVGRWQDMRHVPCPTSALVLDEPTCLPCSGLEDPACVFEPACASDPAACACVATFKGVEHVVYLAFYGTLPKVGMTSRRRVATRLREQGADAFFVLQGGLDRAGARATEKAVSYLYKVPEHRTHREVLPQLARPVPWDAIEARADEWRLRLEGRFEVDRATTRIEDHAVAQPLWGTPRRARGWGRHEGTWLGAKGNHLLYAESARAGRLAQERPPIVAVQRWDLVGRHVTVGVPDAAPHEGATEAAPVADAPLL